MASAASSLSSWQGKIAPSVQPGDRLRDWLRSRSSWPVLLVAAFNVVYMSWLAIGKPGPNSSLVINLSNIPIGIIVAASAWRTWRYPGLDPHTRQAWFFCTLSFASMLTANSMLVVYENILKVYHGTSPSDFFYVAYYIFLLIAFLSFPREKRSRADVVAMILDVTLVVIAASTLVWYLFIGPILNRQHASAWSAFISVIYPVCDLVLLFGSTMALLSRPPQVTRRAVLLLVLGGFGMLVSNAALGYLLVTTGEFQTGGWADLGWQWSPVFMLSAAQYQRWRADLAAEDVGEYSSTTSTFIQSLPFLSILIGYGLLAYVARPYWSHPLGPVLGAAFLLMVIGVTRRWVAVRENTRLVTKQLQRETHFRSLVQHSSDVIAVLNDEYRVTFMSPAVERVFGWTPDAVMGKHVVDIVHREDLPGVMSLVDGLKGRHGANGTVIWRCRNSVREWRYMETVATCLIDDPTVNGIVLNTRDVTERMALQAELTHQAYHDPLTRLANRAWFHTQVEHALERQSRAPEHVAVLFLDLDNFKHINDSLGHAAGDHLLRTVAERLLSATRGSDTVARLGGDEFAILVERVTDIEGLTIIADRVVNSMRLPFTLGPGGDVFSGASIGIARGRPHEKVDDLLRNADVAMYVSKRQGKGGYTFFEPYMHEAVRARLALETDLRHALQRKELEVLYQPIVSLADYHIVGVEALLRWNHRTLGTLMPDQFISVAEESGFIQSIGRWVLEETCRHGGRWRSIGDAGAALTVAVNVSGRQMQDLAFVDDIAGAFHEYTFPADQMILEVTESVLMHDIENLALRLQLLKGLGVRLAIDDFGTGYSSLSSLQQWPVDVLKIDKTFVHGVARSTCTALLQTIVTLGTTLGLETVAEGIEHERQARTLQTMGCRLGQGYYFSPPLPASGIDALLKSGGIVAPKVVSSIETDRNDDPMAQCA